MCSPGRQAGGPAAAGDAGAVHDGTEPAAAAVPVLPTLRVSVCKEISRAMELKVCCCLLAHSVSTAAQSVAFVGFDACSTLWKLLSSIV